MKYMCAFLLSILLVIEIVLTARTYKKRGFTCMFAFEAMYIVVYLLFPIFALTGLGANTDTSQAAAVMKLDTTEITLNAFLMFIFLFLLKMIYQSSYRKCQANIQQGNIKYIRIEENYHEKIFKITNLLLFVGLLSLIILIHVSGGLSPFLSLGQQARGVKVTISDSIGSAATPFVLLSQIVMLPPYLYYYLKNEGYKRAKWLFVFSISIAVIYLLFNQGKGPVFLALIPFLIRKDKRRSIIRLVLLAVCVLALAPLLDSLFRYIAYDYWEYSFDINETLKTFWDYYSLPFANFSYRHEITRQIGLRFGIDYLNWIFNLVPNALLNLIGFTKEGFVSLIQLNTNALINISGRNFDGGLPMDMFLFNYVQLGAVTAVLFEGLFVAVLAKVDARMMLDTRYKKLNVLHYRLGMGVIMLINNFSIESIFRSRLDIFVLFVLYMYVLTKEPKRNLCVNYMNVENKTQ